MVNFYWIYPLFSPAFFNGRTGDVYFRIFGVELEYKFLDMFADV